LNHRERFLRVFGFKDVDRVPDYEFGYWTETIDRWHNEGLPVEKKTFREIELYFGFEGWWHSEWLPIRNTQWPPLPERVLKEEGDRSIVDDGMGGIYMRTVSTSSIPEYIRQPLKNREDWEKLRPFFSADTPGRFPLNWEEIVESYKERDYPLGIDVGSLYGWLRNLMGVRGISIAFYKDPDWIAEMMDTLVDLWIKNIRRALKGVKVDFATWWEDMCYNRGPLLSVRHFEEFMVPRYKKVTEVLKEYGVTINMLDCDGDIALLVPGWLKGGINGMFPIESRHTDIYKLRENYGHRVLIMGGVNKLSLIAGEKGIDYELKKLTPLLKDGGYIPTVDHLVPPEISYQVYKYYTKKKREWIRRTNTK
jgi:uroporphyrinogen decarboxylase